MKKITNYILFFFLLLIPLNVFACPHVDEDGNLHFQFYSDDYSIMTMMYPKENHLYNKNVDFDTDELLSEDFVFPLVQNKETYMNNYYFVDERLAGSDWESVEVKTTVEGLENMDVVGTDYNLTVGLSNTFEAAQNYIDERVFQMYYNVYVDRINDDTESTKYQEINSIIEENELELIVPEILDISAEYFIMDSDEYEYARENVEINDFYDEIEVTIPNDNNDTDIIVINFEDEDSSSRIIDCNYNEETNAYQFTVEQQGTYAIIRNATIEDIAVVEDEEEAIENEESIEDNEELEIEEEKDYTVIIWSSIIIGILVVIGGTIMLFIKQEKGK